MPPCSSTPFPTRDIGVPMGGGLSATLNGGVYGSGDRILDNREGS